MVKSRDRFLAQMVYAQGVDKTVMKRGRVEGFIAGLPDLPEPLEDRRINDVMDDLVVDLDVSIYRISKLFRPQGRTPSF